METGAGALPPPWIFTKVTRELSSCQGQTYPPEGLSRRPLVLASSPELCSRHSQQVLHLCRSLGFSLNEEKSDCRPSQWFEFLGMTFDTLLWLLFPAPPPPLPPPPPLQSPCLPCFAGNGRQHRSWRLSWAKWSPLLHWCLWAAFTSVSFSASSEITDLRPVTPGISTSSWANGFRSPPASGARSNRSLRVSLSRFLPHLSHQPSGTGGCLPGTQTVLPLSARQKSPPPH